MQCSGMYICSATEQPEILTFDHGFSFHDSGPFSRVLIIIANGFVVVAKQRKETGVSFTGR